HVLRRLVVLVAPNDADRRGDAVKLADVILQSRAVAGNTGGKPEPLGAENGVGTAVAETHHCRAAVELRQSAQFGERVGDVGFTGFVFFRTRLRTLGGEFAVGTGEGPWNGAPEQI